MFRVPTDVKAGRAVSINGTSYAKDARIKNADLEWLAGQGNSFPALLSKGVLYTSADAHARKTKAGTPTPGSLPPVILNALIVQEEAQDVPAAPTSLSAVTASSTTVTVSFTAGAANGGAISNYQYKVGTGAWTALAPADATSPVTVPVAAGASGTLRLRAVNVHGVGVQSDTVAYSTVVPAAPTSLVATPGDTTASIAFTAGAANGAPITNYEFTRDDGVTWLAFDPADTATPVVVTGLTNDTEYTIKLRAVSLAGNGTASAAVTVTPTV